MKVLNGKSLNNAIVSGSAFLFTRRKSKVNCIHTEDPAAEKARFAKAQQIAIRQLEILRDTAVPKVCEQLAKIFEIHMMLTLDDDYCDSINGIIDTQLVNAEYAVSLTAYNFSKVFAAMDDTYMKARAADIRDISDRLVVILSGSNPNSAEDFIIGRNKIVCTEDFLPSEIIQFCENGVQGFATAFGSSQSHSAILAKSLDIPSIVGVGWDLLYNVRTGDSITVDGKGGKVILDEKEESESCVS